MELYGMQNLGMMNQDKWSQALKLYFYLAILVTFSEIKNREMISR